MTTGLDEETTSERHRPRPDAEDAELLAEAPPRAPGPTAEPEPEADGPASARLSRGVLGVVAGALFAMVLVQRWGLLTHDTRLDLLIDPKGFLSATWNLWDPTADMGRIQNQAVGYLFPMGPFMLLGAVLQIPPWVVERAWIAFLLIAAMWGMVRLLEALRLGSAPARIVSGLSFALAPFFVARVGNLSAFAQAAAFMPWMLLPLVKGSREGSPRRAAAASGLAVLFMGGVNAVVVAAALVPGGLWLLTRQRGPRRGALIRWWMLAVVAATAWWAVPLAYQRRYGIDFLTFTERAGTTTGVVSPFEVLRGVADWLSYYRARGILVMAGSIEASAGLVIVGGALVVALGLYGMARRSTPERRFLVLTLLAGVVLVGAGFGGSLGNPFGSELVRLLDGPLGLFRNVYKFAPVVLLPVALGVASGIDGLTAFLRRRRPSLGPVTGKVVAGVVAVGVVVGGWPLFGGDLLHHRPFEAVPSWWDQAKAFAETQPGRTLILPGLPLSSSTWGYTSEEPFEWGTTAEWAVRQIAPLGSAGATRVLDTIEAEIERGGSPRLAAYLRDAGFSTVLVRNDGDWQSSSAPSPAQVTLAVRASGLEQVASFGPVYQVTGLTNLLVHPIEMFQVPDAASMSPVSTTPVAASAVVSGDAATPLDLAGSALGDRSVVMAADHREGDPLPPTWLVTDGNQRTFTTFGSNRTNRSYPLTADEPGPGGTDVDLGLLPTERVDDQTVAVRSGVRQVTASTYGSLFVSLPELGPQQAVDGDPTTAWAAAGAVDPERQWIRLRLDEPTDVRQLRVQLLEDGPWRPAVTALEVRTETGSVISAVTPDESEQVVQAPGGSTSWVEVRFAQVVPGQAAGGPGIRELTVPGVTVDQRLRVPDQMAEAFSGPGSTPPSYLFTRATADPHSFLRTDAETELRRLWVAPQSADMDLSATVSAVPGSELVRLLGSTLVFRVTASSTLGDQPAYAPSNLVDGNDGTFWAAASAPGTSTDAAQSGSDNGVDAGTGPSAGRDPDPTVTLEWGAPQQVDALSVTRVEQYSAPESVRVVNESGQVREATIGDDGIARFDPITAQRLDITFPEVRRYEAQQPDGSTVERPVALASLTVPGAPGLGVVASETAVDIPCGEGPTVVIDGRPHDLAIETTLGQVASLDALPAKVCDDGPVQIAAGEHRLDTTRGEAERFFAVKSVRLDPAGQAAADVPPSRSLEVERWAAERRAVRIGPGEESFVAVAENANAGWKATLDGQELRPVTLDGWKQGFVVPAGEGGLISLTYTPTTGYRVALVAGALLVAGLLAMLLVRSRRPAPPPVGEGRPAFWLLVAVVVAVGVLFGGPLVLLALPIVALGRWRPRSLALLAGGSFALAGLVVGLTQSEARQDTWGAFGWVATVLSVVAVLAVASTLLVPGAWGTTGGDDDSDTGADSGARLDQPAVVTRTSARPEGDEP